MMAMQHERGFVRRVWDFIRVARIPGGGESRDIWKLGPVCIKRWSSQVSPVEVRLRCRVSRSVPACNSMWYLPWLHWTVAWWVVGEPASHLVCNAILASHPSLTDIHPGNVQVTLHGPVVLDFALNRQQVIGQVRV